MTIARAGGGFHRQTGGRNQDFPGHRFEWEMGMTQLDRITQSPEVMGGKACIRGMRVTVGVVVGQIGAGHSVDEVLCDYPYLEREDVMQALRYAAWRAEEREIVLSDA